MSRTSDVRRAPAALLVLSALLLCTPSCVMHEHRVGVGPTGAGSESMRQYYIFFGLVALNDVDAQRMSGELAGYSIETRFGWTDFFLTPFLLPLTATSRTVTVHK